MTRDIFTISGLVLATPQVSGPQRKPAFVSPDFVRLGFPVLSSTLERWGSLRGCIAYQDTDLRATKHSSIFYGESAGSRGTQTSFDMSMSAIAILAGKHDVSVPGFAMECAISHTEELAVSYTSRHDRLSGRSLAGRGWRGWRSRPQRKPEREIRAPHGNTDGKMAIEDGK